VHPPLQFRRSGWLFINKVFDLQLADALKFARRTADNKKPR